MYHPPTPDHCHMEEVWGLADNRDMVLKVCDVHRCDVGHPNQDRSGVGEVKVLEEGCNGGFAAA